MAARLLCKINTNNSIREAEELQAAAFRRPSEISVQKGVPRRGNRKNNEALSDRTDRTASTLGELTIEDHPIITEKEVRALFYLWNDALKTGDSRIVAKRYAKKDPILLATVSDEPRTDFAGIKDYFDHFLQKKPHGVILDGQIKIGHGWAKDAGIYEFTMGTTGDKVRARYSYIYTYEDGQWVILHHHSSQMPEPKKEFISEEQVKNLFYLWNDSLDTLDSDLVARRYIKDNAIMLPAFSDTPRTDRESIAAYYEELLLLQPRARILEEHRKITISYDWCRDAGVYEVTMGVTGDKIKARYTLVYAKEDGEFKISSDHSSALMGDWTKFGQG